MTQRIHVNQVNGALADANYLVENARTHAEKYIPVEQLRTDVWLLSVEVRYLRKLLGQRATENEWREL